MDHFTIQRQPWDCGCSEVRWP
uniref:Uncharacterized protein n=1 Tax=Anguilla anguilla TaxID=7936 RepID=A0A0E9TCZ7_ANGAN